MSGVMSLKNSAVRWTVNEAWGFSNLCNKTCFEIDKHKKETEKLLAPKQTKQMKSAGIFYLVQMLWTFYKNVMMSKKKSLQVENTRQVVLDIIRQNAGTCRDLPQVLQLPGMHLVTIV